MIDEPRLFGSAQGGRAAPRRRAGRCAQAQGGEASERVQPLHGPGGVPSSSEADDRRQVQRGRAAARSARSACERSSRNERLFPRCPTIPSRRGDERFDGMDDLGTLLGIWAHPDDDIYLTAGLMAQAVRDGRRVVRVTATRGEGGSLDEERWPSATMGAGPRGRADALPRDPRRHRAPLARRAWTSTWTRPARRRAIEQVRDDHGGGAARHGPHVRPRRHDRARRTHVGERVGHAGACRGGRSRAPRCTTRRTTQEWADEFVPIYNRSTSSCPARRRSPLTTSSRSTSNCRPICSS